MSNKVLKNKIDWFIVNKVRDIRTQKGYSQQAIADHLGISASFVGQIESPSSRAKYKTLHLNELAKLLECSPRDFWPEKAI